MLALAGRSCRASATAEGSWASTGQQLLPAALLQPASPQKLSPWDASAFVVTLGRLSSCKGRGARAAFPGRLSALAARKLSHSDAMLGWWKCSLRVSSLKVAVAGATAEIYENLGLTPCADSKSMGFFHLGSKDKCHCCQLNISNQFIFQQHKHIKDEILA